MKLFIDSANIQQIKKFLEIGVLDGVTTNPTLLAKEGVDPAEQVEKILKLVPGPVSVEVLSTDYEGIVGEARRIAEMGENVVVKAPMTQDGLRAVRTLSRENIKTNVTLVFSPNQGLLAAKAGATYVSPFIGRLDDVGFNGMRVVRALVEIYKNYSITSQIIVSSVRHPIHVLNAAKLGAHIATLPPDVLDKMFNHPLTDVGLTRFTSDWRELEKRLGRPLTPYRTDTKRI
ncbi:MAG: fructose-6-phosphate aldolase [Thermoprotei archaeon]